MEPEPQVFSTNSSNPVGPEPRRPKVLLWVGVGAVVLALAALAGWYVMSGPKGTNKIGEGGGASSDRATSEFYDMLSNAAKQQKLRVAMYRVTYANLADAEAKRHPGTMASSVSEVDTAAGKYRSVFVHNLIAEDGSFNVGRCLDGVTYKDYYQAPATLTHPATTLAEAEQRLKPIPAGNLDRVSTPLIFIPCPHLGLLPASPPMAVARLSDGVFPVTLSEAQAAAWHKQVSQADLFTVKDEGMVTRNGQQLKKLSFSPKQTSDVNQKLYDIFYQAGEIDKIKRDQPKAQWEYEFQSAGPFNTGSVGGFYLIDEQTKLPVYSELYTTNPDKKTGESHGAGLNLARTKQTYAYPAALSLTLDSPLEIRE